MQSSRRWGGWSAISSSPVAMFEAPSSDAIDCCFAVRDSKLNWQAIGQSQFPSELAKDPDDGFAKGEQAILESHLKARSSETTRLESLRTLLTQQLTP